VSGARRRRRPAVNASRASRYREGSRQQQWLALVVVVAAVLGAGLWFLLTRGGEGRARSPTVGARPPEEVGTLLLSVRDADQPLLAVVGGGNDPAVLPIPPSLTVEAPGLGQVDMTAVAQLPGDGMRIAVSNTLGMWVDGFAVTDLGRLAALVDRTGGLRIDLPSAVTLGAVVLGPGEASLDGAQLGQFLAAGADALYRWEIVLTGVLASPPVLGQGDLIEVDDLARAQGLLDEARDATVEAFPTHLVAATTRVPSFTDLDALMRATFGAPAPIVRVIVENHSGAPAVSEDVARILVPLGFRIVLSRNADTFGQPTTDVIAIGSQNVDAAGRVREALGVGSVVLSGVPSGIGDITIAVGSDFSS
jgi:hypothetical protein